MSIEYVYNSVILSSPSRLWSVCDLFWSVREKLCFWMLWNCKMFPNHKFIILSWIFNFVVIARFEYQQDLLNENIYYCAKKEISFVDKKNFNKMM